MLSIRSLSLPFFIGVAVTVSGIQSPAGGYPRSVARTSTRRLDNMPTQTPRNAFTVSRGATLLPIPLPCPVISMPGTCPYHVRTDITTTSHARKGATRMPLNTFRHAAKAGTRPSPKDLRTVSWLLRGL